MATAAQDTQFAELESRLIDEFGAIAKTPCGTW
jgi:hypothetical protein